MRCARTRPGPNSTTRSPPGRCSPTGPGSGRFEQVGHHDRAVCAVADQLGVAWHTIMTQVSERGTPLVDDSTRLDDVSAVGVDETAFLRATGTHPTLYATGADLSPGRPAGAAAGCRPGPLRPGPGFLARRPGRDVAGGDRHRVAGPVPRVRHRAGHSAARRDPRARSFSCRETGPDLCG